MEAGYPKSESEAREHIRQIRREKGLGDGNEQIGHNAADLESALNVLSHDLYQTTTHFLLELIQNADDNSYAGDVTPTLSISHSPGRVRIDCNERGFARKNIEAICRICKSTKSGRSKSAGFVGEKGIGFKAVFKVASTVWISSGYYSFRFDRDGHLGMIAPIWCAFPEKPSVQGGTSIILELAKECDESSIISELNMYDPKILMFLRRLRRIEIDVKQRFWKVGGDFKIALHRQDKEPNGRAQMTMLYKNGVKTNYLVWRHMVENMPKDERRPGITESEIVLAFPLTADEDCPITEDQKIYAFLPVKSIGLQFLLQGDFLLTANREEFHIDSAWNKTLVKAASVAFVDVARHMARLPTNLRYTWLRFVPFQGTFHSTLCNDLTKDLTQKILKADILESNDGNFKKPKDLVHVPKEFRDSKGRPFISTENSSHLSTKYNIYKDRALFNALGVQYVDSTRFQKAIVKHLDGRLSHKIFYKNKDEQWHRDFCLAMNRLDSNFWWHDAKKLYIIPLAGGHWARPNEGFIYMQPANEKQLLPVPQGLQLTMVDEKALKSPSRRQTCEKAGIEDLSNGLIHQIIMNAHDKHSKSTKNFKPESISAQALVSQAVFLFNRGWKKTWNNPEIYMAGDMGDCRLGIDMYFRSNLPSSASCLMPSGPQKSYGFLHSLYKNAVTGGKNEEWLEWLETELGVARYPRLWTFKSRGARVEPWKRHLHGDFAELISHRSAIECLVILRDGWKAQYKEFFQYWKTDANARKGGDYHTCRDAMVTHIRSWVVPCKGRRAQLPLSEAYQPVPSIVEEYGNLAPVVEIPAPEDGNWSDLFQTLSIPGYVTSSFYVECLRAAREAGDSVPMDMIMKLMARMDERKASDNPPVEWKTNNRETIRRVGQAAGSTFFHYFNNPKDPLICIAPKDKGVERKWVSAELCYWTGESWLSGLHCLSELYPQFEIFFRHHVQIPNISSWHLLDELNNVKDWSKHSTARIERLLLGLMHYEAKANHKLITPANTDLMWKQIWPITNDIGNEPFSRWAQGRSSQWLIADRAFFREQFDGRLPVLAFSSDMVFKLMPLIESMGLQKKLLSRVASNVIEAAGDVTLHESLTEKYRSRTSYLVRLMPDMQHDRDHVRNKFGNVEVYLASSIVQHWTAPLGVEQVKSKFSQGLAFLESDYAGDLRIYLKTGYDAEPFPIELADRLTEFFNIPAEVKDLVNVVLTASIERIQRIFDEKGVPPLLEDIPERPETDYQDPPEAVSLARSQTVTNKKANSKAKLGTSQDSRFARLVAHKRFISSSNLSPFNQSVSSLPSYNTAIGKQKTPTGGSTTCEKDKIAPVFYSLDDVEKTLRDMKFQQHDGIVRAKLPEPQGFLERVKNYVQRDNDAAELIACDVLCTILHEKPDAIYSPRGNRKLGPMFSFKDSHGKFSSFLQRLEGSTGRGQGYNRFSFVMDARATTRSHQGQWQFTISQGELDRFRRYSAKATGSYTGDISEDKEVAVLVVIADPRKDPKMLFVPDPWDLYNDGQLLLSASSQGTYIATLGLGTFDNSKGKGKAIQSESGFDAVQIRPHDKATWVPKPPPCESEKPSLKIDTSKGRLSDDLDDNFTERTVSPL